MKKERVDVLLVKQGLFETREQAKRGVMAGLVCNEKNERFDKPGVKVPEDTIFHLKGNQKQYASRGGLKLEKALNDFAVNVKDKVVLDIGASTGGFTDVMLQSGAKLSYALDVGYNQLAWRLRQDPRVVVMERQNFRYSKLEDFTKGQPEFASIDVSFISLKLILPVLATIIQKGGDVVALIKPQFEAGKENVGKNGIVRDPQIHEQVLEDILSFAVQEGFNVEELSFSPIKGGEGNIEFLVHLNYIGKEEAQISPSIPSIHELVAQAHTQLKKEKKASE